MKFDCNFTIEKKSQLKLKSGQVFEYDEAYLWGSKYSRYMTVKPVKTSRTLAKHKESCGCGQTMPQQNMTLRASKKPIT